MVIISMTTADARWHGNCAAPTYTERCWAAKYSRVVDCRSSLSASAVDACGLLRTATTDAVVSCCSVTTRRVATRTVTLPAHKGHQRWQCWRNWWQVRELKTKRRRVTWQIDGIPLTSCIIFSRLMRLRFASGEITNMLKWCSIWKNCETIGFIFLVKFSVFDALYSPTCYDNFGGISMSRVISKLFEMAIIYSSYFVTSDNQKKTHTAVGSWDAMYSIRNVIEHFVPYGSTVNICALDLWKTFGRKNHYVLYNWVNGT